jgi:antitoxin component of RelBE/YafQ-DinJ toxin-antitoxin module
MTITQAIKVFLIKSVMEGGIPFDMTITEEKNE